RSHARRSSNSSRPHAGAVELDGAPVMVMLRSPIVKEMIVGLLSFSLTAAAQVSPPPHQPGGTGSVPPGEGTEVVPPSSLDGQTAERFARLALACVDKEYPNKLSHVLNSDRDVAPPRKLTPAFCGCYDWHSSVHGHWLLARLARKFPQAPFAREAR